MAKRSFLTSPLEKLYFARGVKKCSEQVREGGLGEGGKAVFSGEHR